MISTSYSSNNINSYYLSNQVKNATSTSSTSNSQTTTDDEDTLDLSQALQQLMSMISGGGGIGVMQGGGPQGQPPQGPPPQGPPPSGSPGEDLSKAVEEKQTDFDSALNAKLEAAGVDTDQEITLAYDEDGNIVVTSDVSAEDKTLIESILADDTELSSSFNELMELTAFAAKMEEMFSQGPPPTPPGGMQSISGSANSSTTNASSIASAYAANSTLPSNASTSVTTLMQQLLQALGS